MVKMVRSVSCLLAVALLGYASVPADAAVQIEGQAQVGGGPLAGSTVTLWSASADAPKQLAQTRTDSDGHFNLASEETFAVLYVVAKGGTATVKKDNGDNPAIALLTVFGQQAPGQGGYQRTNHSGVHVHFRSLH